MATQQAVFAEAIAGLKRELKRKAYGMLSKPLKVKLVEISNTNAYRFNLYIGSDSDDEAHGSSNRGKKLLKRGRYVRQGQICISSGPEVYKEV